jgi:alpha-beta hydrolase superfamily lysophospholipase
VTTELGYERRLREWMDARGMRHRRILYERPAAGGTTVAYRLSPADEPRGVVLVAHGAGNDALFAFTGLFKRILRAGLEVFTFDMDGHGRSSTTRFSFPAILDCSRAALAHALEGRAGVPYHCLGVSLGGAILLHGLAGPLAGAASAVLVSAPLRIHFSVGRVVNELRPVLLRTLLRNRHEAGIWGMVPSFGPVKRDLYPLRLGDPRPGAFGYVEALNEVLARMRLVRAAAGAGPSVLLAYGTADRVVPAEQGILLERTLPSSELILVRGGTHLGTVFDDEVVARSLRWMLDRTPAPDPAPDPVG